MILNKRYQTKLKTSQMLIYVITNKISIDFYV